MKRMKKHNSQISPTCSTPYLNAFSHTIGNLNNQDLNADVSFDGSFFSVPSLRNKVNGLMSPLEVDINPQPARNSASQSSINISYDQSPDTTSSIQNHSRNINGTAVHDHLNHSFAYAKQMENKANQLNSRMANSFLLSMSPRQLFSSENGTASKLEEPNLQSRKRRCTIDDLNMQTYLSISQQTVTQVERFVKYSEICPDRVNEKTPNRFMNPSSDPVDNDSKIRCFNPIFNATCLLGMFADIDEVNRTPLAVVYKARHRLSGLIYCIKRSRCEFETDKHFGSSLHEMHNEVQALSIINHPNIVSYYSSWFELDSIFLKLEYCLGGSLFHLLNPHRVHDTTHNVSLPTFSSLDGCFDEMAVDNGTDQHPSASISHHHHHRFLPKVSLMNMFTHILSAIHYLHNSKWSLIHGDIKPSNILLQMDQPIEYLASVNPEALGEAKLLVERQVMENDAKNVLFKLADLGRVSRAGEDRDGDDLGDGRYLPCLDEPSEKVVLGFGRDIYALGVTIYETSGGPMQGQEWDNFKQNSIPLKLNHLPSEIQEIVSNMLKSCARDRPTTRELIKEPALLPYLSLNSVFDLSLLDIIAPRSRNQQSSPNMSTAE